MTEDALIVPAVTDWRIDAPETLRVPVDILGTFNVVTVSVDILVFCNVVEPDTSRDPVVTEEALIVLDVIPCRTEGPDTLNDPTVIDDAFIVPVVTSCIVDDPVTFRVPAVTPRIFVDPDTSREPVVTEEALMVPAVTDWRTVEPETLRAPVDILGTFKVVTVNVDILVFCRTEGPDTSRDPVVTDDAFMVPAVTPCRFDDPDTLRVPAVTPCTFVDPDTSKDPVVTEEALMVPAVND